MIKALAFTLLATIAAPQITYAANGFGCAGVAGEVLFKDTLYGVGTGVLVAGVVEATRDDHESVGRRLGNGAAIGGGIGFALGLLEITLRDCSERSRVNRVEAGWQRPNWLLSQSSHGTGYGIGIGYRFQ